MSNLIDNNGNIVTPNNSEKPLSAKVKTPTEITKELEGDFYKTAVTEVRKEKTATVTKLQRTLKIGYNRAARLLEAMQEDGIISDFKPNGSRAVNKSA